MAKINADQLVLLHKDLVDVWRPAHEVWRESDTVLNMKHDIRYVKPAEPRKLPSARTKLQGMIDTMVASMPQVDRAPVRDTEDSKRKADKTEIWAKAELERAAKISLVPPSKVFSRYLAQYGYAVWPTRWNSKAFLVRDPDDLRANLKSQQLPFDLTVPNPARVLLPHYEAIPSFAVETMSLTIREAQEKFPDVADQFSGSPLSLVQCMYYWDEDNLYVTINGREALSDENPYGFVPYAHAFAGYGYERTPKFDGTNGTPTGTDWSGFGPSPKDLAEGLLAGTIDLIKSKDEWYTAMLAKAIRGAYLNIFTSMDPTELSDNMKKAGLGGVIPVDAGRPIDQQIQWEKPPPASQEAQEVFNVMQDEYEKATFVGVVQGFRSPGVSTATQHAEQLGQARLRFDVPMMKVNHVAGQVIGNCAKMLTVMEETIELAGVKVSGSDFEGNYDFTVKYEARDEAALLRAKDIGLQELQVGAIDLETYWADTGRSDASGLKKKLDVQKIVDDPQTIATVRQAADMAFRQKHGLPAPMPQQPPSVPGQVPGVDGMTEPLVPGPQTGSEQVTAMTNGVAPIQRAM